MIDRMRTMRRQEPGRPAAAFAIIAAIFGAALIIKVLPPAAHEAIVSPSLRVLPSRALLIWATDSPFASAVAAGPTRATARFAVTNTLPRRNAGLDIVEPVETLGQVALTFERDPGQAPVLPAKTLMLLASPVAAAADPLEVAAAASPLVMPLAKTGSALRVAFSKTSSAIKAAASGTAGVFSP